MSNIIRARCLALVDGRLCGGQPVAAFAFSEQDHALPLCQEHFDWAQSCYDELDQIVAGVTS